MIIGALQKTTLIDYPGKVAALVFTAGCNFNCGFCYNSSLREIKPGLSEKELFDFLDSRVGKLDAVSITGGEPTIHSDLPKFIGKIKKRGFLVKLDTQGSNPEMLEKIIDGNLIDYVAMDIKGPFEKYREITNVLVDEKKIKKSIDLIMNRAPDYEFRTTTVLGQLDFDDFEKIGEMIKGARRYFIQKFMPVDSVNDPKFKLRRSPDEIQLEKMKSIMKKYVDEVGIR